MGRKTTRDLMITRMFSNVSQLQFLIGIKHLSFISWGALIFYQCIYREGEKDNEEKGRPSICNDKSLTWLTHMNLLPKRQYKSCRAKVTFRLATNHALRGENDLSPGNKLLIAGRKIIFWRAKDYLSQGEKSSFVGWKIINHGQKIDIFHPKRYWNYHDKRTFGFSDYMPTLGIK